MDIQWYPGHMAKARRMLSENLKLIDVVVELLDARAPMASRNPDFLDLFSGKTRLVLLNKSDLASAAATRAWVGEYASKGIVAAGIDSRDRNVKKTVGAMISRAAQDKVAKWEAKGVQRVVRCMVVGIPNVGKSTLINRMAGENKAATGDRPGVTKSKQWVKITPYLELMDTPGLLWPKLEDQTYAKHLAYLGSINDEIMDMEHLAESLLTDLERLAPEAVSARYPTLHQGDPASAFPLLTGLCKGRGFLLKGGEWDTERGARIVLDEFRAGKTGRITLELPEDEHGKNV